MMKACAVALVFLVWRLPKAATARRNLFRDDKIVTNDSDRFLEEEEA
jgi:hypothetical protein